jgi:chorismate mutase
MAIRNPRIVLDEGRKMIDSLNETMIELLRMGALANSPVMREMLKIRTGIAATLGQAKRELGLPLVDEEREACVVNVAVRKAAEIGVNEKRARLLMGIAIRSARKAQEGL